MKGVTYTAIGRRSIRNVFNIGIKEVAKFVVKVLICQKNIFMPISYSHSANYTCHMYSDLI